MSLLMPREVEALHCALDLASQGWAAADQVIRDHGPVRPFTRIREAERRRIQEMWRLFVIHGLPIPANRWTGVMPSALSLSEACRQGEELDRARLRRMRQLLANTDHEDLRGLFRRLMAACEERHLPAYERCGQCRNTQAGGCPDGPSRPGTAPPRRCGARAHQDWLWTE